VYACACSLTTYFFNIIIQYSDKEVCFYIFEIDKYLILVCIDNVTIFE